jgi:hypothetical protein
MGIKNMKENLQPCTIFICGSISNIYLFDMS